MECNKVAEEKLLPPYDLTYNKLLAMFQDDPCVEISPLNDADRTCTFGVSNYFKYLIYKDILITDYEHDNAGLLVNIEYIGEDQHPVDEITLGYVLESNPHFLEVIKSENPMLPMNSAVFKKEVIQYYSDNFFSPYGHDTTIAEHLIKEFLVDPAVNTCTDTHPAQ